MALHVIAYPQLLPHDYAWIQAIRTEHDPQYTIVEPHITLVFPTTRVDQAQFTAHVQAQAAHIGCIPFTIRCALIVKDPLSLLTHLFLVPDQGFSQLVKLHDTLYTHALASSLRLDIAYIPHVTIGAFTDPIACKQIADRINQDNIAIQGQINTLDIILDTPPLSPSLARIRLT